MTFTQTSFIKNIGLIFVFIALFLTVITSNSTAQNKPEVVVDEYIVVLNDNVSDRDIPEIAKEKGLGLQDQYTNVFKGFSSKIPKNKLESLKNDPRVQFVSENKIVGITAQTIPNGLKRVGADISTNEGTGVGVAVIDSGVDLNHSDLRSNIIGGKNCVRTFRAPNDDNGHGTHVAGTIAAVNNTTGVLGVASQAKIIPVKVLGPSGSGTWSQVICGLDYIVANAATLNIKVANMSLGGGGLSDNNCGNTNADALHKAICRVRDAGVTVVVSAGNSGANASGFVPAAYDDAVITVSALNDSNGIPGGSGPTNSYGADDTFPSFSNFGSVVDIASPGVNIYSTYRGGGYATMSGTSMASPHVAGAAALFINSNPGASWTTVRDSLKTLGEPLSPTTHTDPSGKHPEPVLRVNTL